MQVHSICQILNNVLLFVRVDYMVIQQIIHVNTVIFNAKNVLVQIIINVLNVNKVHF